MIHQAYFRLHTNCSIIQAELIAIFRCLIFLSMNKRVINIDIQIVTDSAVSIALIKRPKRKQPLSFKINQLLLKPDLNNKIKFCWVPSHSGNPGNDLADKLARNVKHTVNKLTYNAIPISALKRNLSRNSILNWQEQWNCSEKGRRTFCFFPNIDERLRKTFQPNFHLTQLLTGHGNFREYLNRFNIRDTNYCDCDNVTVQDVNHLIFNCQKFVSYRVALERKVIGEGENWPCRLDTFVRKKNILSAFEHFVKTTGITDHLLNN